MEEKEKGGYDRQEERRSEYADRKPRYNTGRRYDDRRTDRDYSTSRSYATDRSYSSHEGSEDNGERRRYPSQRSYGNGPRRSYGDRKPYNGERRSYDKPYGERRGSYGTDRQPQDGEQRTYSGGEHKPYNANGERRPYGPRKPFAPYRSYGNARSEGGERRGGGDRREGGERREGGFRPKPRFNRNGGAPSGFAKWTSAPRKKDVRYDKAEAGIDRMLARKPKLGDDIFSDNDQVQTPVQEVVRLNKFIANSGVCSRREADTLIQTGVVTVNGEVVTELGTKINIFTDDVRFNGERLKGEEKVYIVMNKPKGYVTTASDPHAERTVMDLLKGCPMRVFPVGRLDKNTTGVLMFTNDGEMAEKLTHPSYDKKKIYQVILDIDLQKEDLDKVLEGVELNDGPVKADELEYIDSDDHRKLGIEIHSGKNRIVRRIFESLGYEVRALDRVYFAGLTKKGLKKGQWRYLSDSEVNVLKMGAYV